MKYKCHVISHLRVIVDELFDEFLKDLHVLDKFCHKLRLYCHQFVIHLQTLSKNRHKTSGTVQCNRATSTQRISLAIDSRFYSTHQHSPKCTRVSPRVWFITFLSFKIMCNALSLFSGIFYLFILSSFLKPFYFSLDNVCNSADHLLSPLLQRLHVALELRLRSFDWLFSVMSDQLRKFYPRIKSVSMDYVVYSQTFPNDLAINRQPLCPRRVNSC